MTIQKGAENEQRLWGKLGKKRRQHAERTNKLMGPRIAEFFQQLLHFLSQVGAFPHLDGEQIRERLKTLQEPLIHKKIDVIPKELDATPTQPLCRPQEKISEKSESVVEREGDQIPYTVVFTERSRKEEMRWHLITLIHKMWFVTQHIPTHVAIEDEVRRGVVKRKVFGFR